MSEWLNCQKCGTLIENLCACSNPECVDYRQPAPPKNDEWEGFYKKAGDAIHLVGVLIARLGLDPDMTVAKQVESQVLCLLDERNTLIMSVARKFDGETRFETALRYIREAEERATSGPATQAEPKPAA